MSASPVLSYKKPSSARQDANGTPVSSPITPDSDGKFEAGPATPRTASRKISSRRKALQDFYHIQQQQSNRAEEAETQSSNSENQKPSISPGNDLEDIVSRLNDAEQLNQFVKETPIEDILKLRNKVTSTLNAADSEKKTIIYDNYFELIKLSKTLDHLTNPNSKPDPTFADLKIGEADTENIDQNYIYDSLYSLKDFLDDKMTKLDQDFSNVVKALQTENSTEVGSVTGAKHINETEPKFGENIDKNQLIEEINLLLSSPNKQDSAKLANSVEKIVTQLDNKKDKLLILELKKIRDDIRSS